MNGKRIHARVIPRAGKNEVIEEKGRFRVRVSAAPEDGKANRAVCELLAKYFGVRVSEVRIVQGEKSRNKVIGIREGKQK